MGVIVLRGLHTNQARRQGPGRNRGRSLGNDVDLGRDSQGLCRPARRQNSTGCPGVLPHVRILPDASPANLPGDDVPEHCHAARFRAVRFFVRQRPSAGKISGEAMRSVAMAVVRGAACEIYLAHTVGLPVQRSENLKVNATAPRPVPPHPPGPAVLAYLR